MKNKYITLFLFNLLIVFPLIFLSFFTYPTSDDFSYGIGLINSNFIEVNIDRYMDWTSRYIATSILVMSPIAFNSVNYFGFYPVIFISLFLFSFNSLYRTLKIDIYKSFILSLSSLSVYTLLVTSLVENYYWLAGSTTYFFPSCIFILYLTILIKLIEKQNIYYALLSVFFLFIIGGCTEILVGYALITTVLFLFYFYKMNKKMNTVYLINIVFLFIIIIGIVFSPGNGNRESVMGNNLSLLEIFIMSFKKVLAINFRYNILLFIFLYFIIRQLNIKIKPNDHYKYHVILLLLGMFTFIFLGSFVSIYGLKMYFPPRVENLLIFTSLLFLIFIAIIINSNLNLGKKYISGIFVLGVLLYFVLPKNEFQKNNNFILMYSDILSGKVVNYKRQMIDRDIELRKCSGDCEINKIKNPPRSIMFKDIGDENHYINKSMSVLYKVNKIILKD